MLRSLPFCLQIKNKSMFLETFNFQISLEDKLVFPSFQCFVYQNQFHEILKVNHRRTFTNNIQISPIRNKKKTFPAKLLPIYLLKTKAPFRHILSVWLDFISYPQRCPPPLPYFRATAFLREPPPPFTLFFRGRVRRASLSHRVVVVVVDFAAVR